MTATPTTTKLGPDQARLRDLMRRLAEATSTEAPILSLYIDVRPEAHGERPGERNELTVVTDRLNEIAGTLEPHADARESFDADRRRIEQLLESEDLNDTDGVAVFACQRIGLWEPIGSQIRQASLTDARVEVVREHAALLRYEGVGATLRFRIGS